MRPPGGGGGHAGQRRSQTAHLSQPGGAFRSPAADDQPPRTHGSCIRRLRYASCRAICESPRTWRCRPDPTSRASADFRDRDLPSALPRSEGHQPARTAGPHGKGPAQKGDAAVPTAGERRRCRPAAARPAGPPTVCRGKAIAAAPPPRQGASWPHCPPSRTIPDPTGPSGFVVRPARRAARSSPARTVPGVLRDPTPDGHLPRPTSLVHGRRQAWPIPRASTSCAQNAFAVRQPAA